MKEKRSALVTCHKCKRSLDFKRHQSYWPGDTVSAAQYKAVAAPLHAGITVSCPSCNSYTSFRNPSEMRE